MSETRHIAIIGGGIIGSSILYYLSKAQPDSKSKLHLTLLEESSSLAPAASSKSGGFLASDWHSGDTASLGKLSYKLHEQLAREDGGEKRWGYREVETLSVKYDSTKKANKSSNKSLPSWLDTEHIVSSSNMGGNHTTAQVTPLDLVRHLVAQSQELSKNSEDKLKVDVRLGWRANEIAMENGKVKQLKVSSSREGDEVLNVSDVVVAAGPWTGSLLASLLPSPLLTSPSKSLSFLKHSSKITGSRAHSIVVKSSSPTTAHCLFTDMRYVDPQGDGTSAGAPEVYARNDGTVYVCGGSDSVKLPKNADEVKHDSKQTEKLKEQTKVLSPETLGKDAEVVKEQACYLPMSPSTGSPILAGDSESGIYLSAGHSCWGITLSLGTGLCMAELILEGKVQSADVDELVA